MKTFFLITFILAIIGCGDTQSKEPLVDARIQNYYNQFAHAYQWDIEITSRANDIKILDIFSN